MAAPYPSCAARGGRGAWDEATPEVHAGKYRKPTKSLTNFWQIELLQNNQIKAQVKDGEKKSLEVPTSTIEVIFRQFSTAKTNIHTLVSNKTTALY